jgi:hypothetical protein
LSLRKVKIILMEGSNNYMAMSLYTSIRTYALRLIIAIFNLFLVGLNSSITSSVLSRN